MTISANSPERPVSECPTCSGSTWRVIEAAGKGRVAVRCDCFVSRRTERVLKSIGIPPRHASCTLTDFEMDFPGANKSLASARLAAGRFVEEYSPGTDGLLLVGPVGTGKTHLAVGIVRELVSATVKCLFCDYRGLLKEIQNSYNASVEATEQQILAPIFDAELLVLDDVGCVKTSQWVWDTVSSVINYRYNEKKTTIFTTNFPDLPETNGERPADGFSRADRARASREDTLGDRITNQMLSRLHEMCKVIELKGDDFRGRLTKKPAQAVPTSSSVRAYRNRANSS